MLFKRKEKEPSFVLRDHFLFDVVGVTFDNEDGTNRQDVLKRLAADTRQIYSGSDRYLGYKNKEIEEEDIVVGELEGLIVPNIEIEQTEYEGSPAFRVMSPYGIVGFIPKDRVDDFIRLDEKHKNAFLYATITGGKQKSFDYDLEKIQIKELIYGMSIKVEFSTPVTI